MALLETPDCEFGTQAPDFSLRGVDGKHWTRDEVRGEHGLVVMFICNHCPYVKGILERLVKDAKTLMELGVGCVAINANDPTDYPEDSYDNMVIKAKELGFSFPYLMDETQQIAKAYGAVCTPDFFGYNRDLELQYRGRFDNRVIKENVEGAEPELRKAMMLIKETGKGPSEQTPSMGCSIKWKSA